MKGFLLSEIIIAFALLTLFLGSFGIMSASGDRLLLSGDNTLNSIHKISTNISSTTLLMTEVYGNNSVISKLNPISFVTSKYQNEWGRDTCDTQLVFDANNSKLYPQFINNGAGNVSTDLEVKNKIVYLTTDSGVASAPDFYIFDASNPTSAHLLSSLNTGPGLSSVEIAGPYAYTANLGTTNQLQIIDIHDRKNPVLITKFKLPLPRASSTPPLASTLFYHLGKIYLGTEKWEGSEFVMIDVADPLSPIYLGGYKTDTKINSIYVYGTRAYVADSDSAQLRVLDVSDPINIKLISSFSPSGWETQQGKTISFFESRLHLGRTVGGFDNIQNHELFELSSTTNQANSKNIPGGVYGVINRNQNLYIATHSLNKEFQILTDNLSDIKSQLPLGFIPIAMTCDHGDFYFATGDSAGFSILKNSHER